MNIAVDRVFQSSDWIVLVFFLIFGLLAVLKLLYPKRLNAFLGCFFSKNYFLDYATELQEKYSLFHFFLLFVQNLIGALFLYVFVIKLDSNAVAFEFGGYLKILAGLTLYLFCQMVLGRLVAFLFRIDDLYEGFFLLKFSYLKVITIYSLPVLLLWIYSFPGSSFMSFVAVGFVSILLIARWFLIVINKITLFKMNSFYFILYICTLEIVPLVLVIKLMIQIN